METGENRAMRLAIVTAAAAVMLTGSGAGSTSPGSTVALHPLTVAQTSQPISRDDLSGTWRPVVMFGRDVQRLARITVRFRSDPQREWTGYDGCNWTNGTFHVGRSGWFVAIARTTTLRACFPRVKTANVTVMTRATRVALQDGRLNLYSPSGHKIGVYVRAS